MKKGADSTGKPHSHITCSHVDDILFTDTTKGDTSRQYLTACWPQVPINSTQVTDSG